MAAVAASTITEGDRALLNELLEVEWMDLGGDIQERARRVDEVREAAEVLETGLLLHRRLIEHGSLEGLGTEPVIDLLERVKARQERCVRADRTCLESAADDTRMRIGREDLAASENALRTCERILAAVKTGAGPDV
jgi:hypothetical protein